MSSEFLLTSLIVVLLPGTGVIYTVSTGLSRGAKASIFAAEGCKQYRDTHRLALSKAIQNHMVISNDSASTTTIKWWSG
jgi:threonine/homoserine/homoserine lactone efflux protein